MGFLKRWLIKRALKQANSKSDMEKIADDVLKDAMKELQQTGRTADKILKAKLMRQESHHALSKIKELDEEFADDEEQQEAPQSMEDMLATALMTKIIGGGLGNAAPQQKGEITSYDDEGKPVYAATPQPQAAPEAPSIADIAKKLSPADIEALKKKFL